MSHHSADTTTELSMKTCGLPLNKRKTIVDFFKGMYDVLEAHRWAVAEHKLLHRDISHSNIIVEVPDVRNAQEFSGTKRPVFINEVLHSKPAPPMARLLDMDDSANLDTSRAKPEKGKAAMRHCDIVLVHRSSLRDRLLMEKSWLNLRPMPTLQSDTAAKYDQAYHADTSKLRSFSDANGSSHGGYLDSERTTLVQTDPDSGADMFAHQPVHDAESVSVYWCIAAFVLLARPLENDVDEGGDAFDEMWTCLMEHEVGSDNDTRRPLIQRGRWKRWLHKDLSFIADLMVSLGFQVRPEWALLTPAPHPLHLHEAMQRLIPQLVHDWEKERINADLDTVHSRTFKPVERKTMAPVDKHLLIGQVITSSTLGKRGSDSLAGRAQSGSKRLRKAGNDEPLEAALAELKRAWVDLHCAHVAPEALEYGSEDENEGDTASG